MSAASWSGEDLFLNRLTDSQFTFFPVIVASNHEKGRRTLDTNS